MEYLGADTYKFYLDDKEIILKENDIKHIIDKYETNFKENDYNLVITNQKENQGYLFTIKGKEIMLTPFEVGLFVREYNKHFDDKLDISKPFKPTRAYNKSNKIKQLFKKYKTATKTNKEIFSIIAKELNISIKAVDKAYYKK